MIRKLLQNYDQSQDAMDLNIMIIVELRAKNLKNLAKNLLITRQVQFYNVHIPSEKKEILLRESEYFVGGQQLPSSGFVTREMIPEPSEWNLLSSLFRQKRSFLANYGMNWFPSRYSFVPNGAAHRRSEPMQRKLIHLTHAQNSFTTSSGNNRRVYADKSASSTTVSGLRYKYRWRLKLFNRNLMSSRTSNNNFVIDSVDEALLSNLTNEGCNLGYTGTDCLTRMFSFFTFVFYFFFNEIHE